MVVLIPWARELLYRIGYQKYLLRHLDFYSSHYVRVAKKFMACKENWTAGFHFAMEIGRDGCRLVTLHNVG